MTRTADAARRGAISRRWVGLRAEETAVIVEFDDLRR
jgi:hypothetical protein